MGIETSSLSSLSAAKLRFSFVLYLTQCNAGRGAADAAASSDKRLEYFGGGLRRNASAIVALFPHATMLVHVPAHELLDSVISPLLKPFLEALQADFAHVRVVPFELEEVGFTVADRMSLGQRLRCGRYLPLFAPRGAPQSTSDFVPVVVRDADSIVSAADGRLILQWLNTGRRWLIYQEHMMPRMNPLGGGIACAAPVTGRTMSAASGHAVSDEALLGRLMPFALAVHVHATAGNRCGAVSYSSDDVSATNSFMYVLTRMSPTGDWYRWTAKKQGGGVGHLLWPVHSLQKSKRAVRRTMRGSDRWSR